MPTTCTWAREHWRHYWESLLYLPISDSILAYQKNKVLSYSMCQVHFSHLLWCSLLLFMTIYSLGIFKIYNVKTSVSTRPLMRMAVLQVLRAVFGNRWSPDQQEEALIIIFKWTTTEQHHPSVGLCSKGQGLETELQMTHFSLIVFFFSIAKLKYLIRVLQFSIFCSHLSKVW